MIENFEHLPRAVGYLRKIAREDPAMLEGGSFCENEKNVKRKARRKGIEKKMKIRKNKKEKTAGGFLNLNLHFLFCFDLPISS